MKRIFSIGMFMAFVVAGTAWPAPLRFVPTVVLQPNGDTVRCFSSGDEFYNWLHDKDNFTILRNPSTGFLVYAVRRGDELASSPYIVNTVDPKAVGLIPGVKHSPERIRALREAIARGPHEHPPEIRYTPRIGAINNIAVFIRFNDESEFSTLLSSYETMFNSSVTATNSMNNYFHEASYGQLTVTTTFYPLAPGSTVVSYQDSHPRAYFQPYDAIVNPIGYQGGDNGTERFDRENALLVSALTAIASQVPVGLNIDGDNDGLVDNVCFVVYGSPTGWASLLWPHMSGMSSVATINGKRVSTYNFQLQSMLGVGVLCHEMFHSLGSPDLYHYSHDGLTPVYTWDIMDYNANPPQHMGAYMKQRYGSWIASIPQITVDGTYSLHSLLSPTNNCYKIASPFSSTEYFVVEYRRQTGTFESQIPGTGLLVYRINTTRWGNAGGPPDEVYIYRPDGTVTANGEPWLAAFSSDAGRTAINDSTNPSSILSNGSPGGLNISNVGSSGDSITFTVSFPSVSVRIQTNPPGFAFMVDSVQYVSSHDFVLAPNTQHIIEAVSPVNPTADSQYAWISWSDGGAIRHTIPPITNPIITANFVKQYYLSMNAAILSSQPQESNLKPLSIWPIPSSGYFPKDSTVAINLYTLDSPVYFRYWTGHGPGSYTGPNRSSSLVMHGAIAETAYVGLCGFVLSPPEIYADSAGGTFSCRITQGGPCGWSVYPPFGVPSWVQNIYPMSGLGDTIMTLTILPMTQDSSRDGWIPLSQQSRYPNHSLGVHQRKHLTGAPLLNVASRNPDGGVPVSISPVDSGGHGDGVTPLKRLYAKNKQVSLTAPASAFGVPRWSSILACYNFSGDAQDMTGKGHNGVATNVTPVQDRRSAPNSAYSFNGSSSTIDCGVFSPPLPINSFTLSAWINIPSSRLPNYRVIATNSGSYRGFKVYTVWDSIRFEILWPPAGSRFVTVSIGAPEDLHTWMHLVCVSSNGELKMYKNGILRSANSGSPGDEQTSTPLTFGFDPYFNSGQYDGMLDDVRIYGQALADADVQSLYQEGMSAFLNWQKDGLDFSGSRTVTIGMDTNYTLTAIYGSPSSTASLSVKAFLEGPFDISSSRMKTDLKVAGILAQHFVNPPIPGEAVDSVTLEIRNAALSQNATVRKFAPAWLLSDGTIRNFVDTTKNYVLFDTSGGSFYAVIWHRNHLGIMSAAPFSLSTTPVLYDFTTSQSQAYGTNPMKLLGTKYCIYAGDANQSAIVSTADANGVLGVLNSTGYDLNDINLSGIITAADANMVFGNLNISSQVSRPSGDGSNPVHVKSRNEPAATKPEGW